MDQEPPPDDAAPESEVLAPFDESIRRHLAPFVEEARQKALEGAKEASVDAERRLAVEPDSLSLLDVDHPEPAQTRLTFDRPITAAEAARFLWGKTLERHPESVTGVLPVPESMVSVGVKDWRGNLVIPNRFTEFFFSEWSSLADVRPDVQWRLGDGMRPTLGSYFEEEAPWVPNSVRERFIEKVESAKFSENGVAVSVKDLDFELWVARSRDSTDVQAFQYFPDDLEYYENFYPNDATLARRKYFAFGQINQGVKFRLDRGREKGQPISPREARLRTAIQLEDVYSRWAIAALGFAAGGGRVPGPAPENFDPETTKQILEMMKLIKESREEQEEYERRKREGAFEEFPPITMPPAR